MKRVMRKIALLAAALMIMAVPVLAEEGAIMPKMEPAEQSGKNECLLLAMNCPGRMDSIQERIDRIQGEIDRGTDVYTNDELRILQDKLDDAIRNVDEITSS